MNVAPDVEPVVVFLADFDNSEDTDPLNELLLKPNFDNADDIEGVLLID